MECSLDSPFPTPYSWKAHLALHWLISDGSLHHHSFTFHYWLIWLTKPFPSSLTAHLAHCYPCSAWVVVIPVVQVRAGQWGLKSKPLTPLAHVTAANSPNQTNAIVHSPPTPNTQPATTSNKLLCVEKPLTPPSRVCSPSRDSVVSTLYGCIILHSDMLLSIVLAPLVRLHLCLCLSVFQMSQ